ncbi:MAG: NADH dehydrogenase ubiquinone Fe-S protein 4 [Rickettsiales bacterium]
MYARIYRPAPNPMQSGRASAPLPWTLEFSEDADPNYIEPVMGWTGNLAPRRQIRLGFASREGAESYARRIGIPFSTVMPHEKRFSPKSYADNFKRTR